MDLSPRVPKRPASASPPSSPLPQTLQLPSSSSANNGVPRILSRHHARRVPLASQLWGPAPLACAPGQSIPIVASRANISSSSATGLSLLAPSTTPTTLLPPPPSGTRPQQPFNIYPALLSHRLLFHTFILSLPLPSAIALYSIDKTFHYRFNHFSLSLILSYATHHAPIAAPIFSPALFPDLLISDPMMRPMDGRSWLARDVPGWKWVGMVLWRQGVVQRLMKRVGVQGREVEAAVCKFWLLMETCEARVRQAFVSDESVWGDGDVVAMQRFVLALGMRVSHPILGNGAGGMAHLLLGLKSMVSVLRVLDRKTKLEYDDVVALVVRAYPMEELDAQRFPWLEDAEHEELWGILMRDGWEPTGERMESALDMVLEEGVRREIGVQGMLVELVAGTGKSGVWLGNKRVGKTDGWPGKRERKAVIEGLNKRCGVVEVEKVAEDVEESEKSDSNDSEEIDVDDMMDWT